jgi:hypothetical protein
VLLFVFNELGHVLIADSLLGFAALRAEAGGCEEARSVKIGSGDAGGSACSMMYFFAGSTQRPLSVRQQ